MTIYDPPVITHTPLASITLSASTSSVIFANINNSYRDLVIIANIDNSTQTELFIEFNGDATSSYTSTRMQGSGSVAGYNVHSGTGMRLVGNGDIMTDFSFNAIINLNDYSATDKHKPVLSRTSSSQGIDATVGRWASTSAITSIRLYPNAGTFESGSIFTLHGIEA